MQTRDSIKDIWGPRTKYDDAEWPERVDERTLEDPDEWVQSACVLCSNGCALDIGVRDGKIVGVRGRGIDRVNKGRLGPKGLNGWEANNSRDRLTKPLVRRGGKLVETSWEKAMQEIVDKSKSMIEKFGRDSVAFYNTGQLFLEEYYTLSVVTKAGIGTNHVDGNTRLCTATAAQALQETFGSDGQPGSYTDFDLADCILMCGHNMSNTQTVLWSRILDRRKSASPPTLIVIDPRTTETAKEADIHIAPKVGTNVALMNGLIHLVIENGDIDQEFIEKHTVSFEHLKEVCAKYTPDFVEELTGVPTRTLKKAAKAIGQSNALVSTVLQGFYQSNQATAASCQVNNLNLIRGMIGKPGCTVFQFNGQPTAQNTRETGCDGSFPAFANVHNKEHLDTIAERWNIDPLKMPTWHLPTHVMEIFRHCETGSIKFLWIIGTNPAVTLPELHRIRKIIAQSELFVVVSDPFLTETADLADVVLPAAIWGEKTGTFTNVDRTVHLSRKAVDPPGEAKSDLDIFLMYAEQMGFVDKEGEPLVKWTDPESAFDAWRKFTKGWFCDYSGMTYEKLSGSGMQWPCNRKYPEGKERLYEDFKFRTDPELCESYGHDLELGAAVPVMEYKAKDPKGRAFLKAAEYRPPMEVADDEYPFWVTTGRVVYHFHTRTKTGRSGALQAAAPDVFAQISEEDAEELGIKEGELIRINSRRGSVVAPARIGGIIPKHVFIPFHYGYWDEEDPQKHTRAANELTVGEWCPVSKQPYFKCAAVQIAKASSVAAKVSEVVHVALDQAKELADKTLAQAHIPRYRIADAVGLIVVSMRNLIGSCETLAAHHFEDYEVLHGMREIKRISEDSLERLQPFEKVYGQVSPSEMTRIAESSTLPLRAGEFGLLRDLQNLVKVASEVHVYVISLGQAARGLRDIELLSACDLIDEGCKRAIGWLNTQIEHRAAHAIATKY